MQNKNPVSQDGHTRQQRLIIQTKKLDDNKMEILTMKNTPSIITLEKNMKS
uniref:Uncharacterized protein n=1 Tax=Rhizophora mucronata TaxID=61149 RepID=A0A2P2NJ29_RHIMU